MKQSLPDHLVENIIALLPFPSVFTARCLSKSWYARFSSIGSQDDEAKKHAAIIFQALVRERSRSWKTFCPVFIGTNGDLVAYDKDFHNWQKMPSVSFLPDIFLNRSNLQIEGALLYASDTPSSEFNGELYVANILTHAWKILRPPPTTGFRVHSSKLVVTDRSLETYKVVLFCDRDLYPNDFHFIQIYDSKLDSWSSKPLYCQSYYRTDCKNINLNSVYLDGVLYMGSVTQWGLDLYLWAFHVEEGTFNELRLSSRSIKFDELDYFHLVVCNDELLMVTGMEEHRNEGQYVLKIDLATKSMVLLSTGSRVPAALKAWSRAMAPVGFEHHIFFGFVGKHGTQMRAYLYHHQEDFWCRSLFSPPTTSADCKYNCIGSFQPGLRPFAAV